MEIFALVRNKDGQQYDRVFPTRYTGASTLRTLRRRGLNEYWKYEAKSCPEIFEDLSKTFVVPLQQFDDWAERKRLLSWWCGAERRPRIRELIDQAESGRIGFRASPANVNKNIDDNIENTETPIAAEINEHNDPGHPGLPGESREQFEKRMREAEECERELMKSIERDLRELRFSR